ncbi:solute carrier family 25 protein, partial [Klebsiella pneumoniae]|nr:solute carrier family 25 protein [Klebsiella pneumoniae]
KKDGRGIQDYNPILERAFLTGLSAGISGTIAAVVTTPIDVVKTRVMLAASDGSVSGVSKEEKKKIGTRGTLDVGREIY